MQDTRPRPKIVLPPIEPLPSFKVVERDQHTLAEAEWILRREGRAQSTRTFWLGAAIAVGLLLAFILGLVLGGLA